MRINLDSPSEKTESLESIDLSAVKPAPRKSSRRRRRARPGMTEAQARAVTVAMACVVVCAVGFLAWYYLAGPGHAPAIANGGFNGTAPAGINRAPEGAQAAAPRPTAPQRPASALRAGAGAMPRVMPGGTVSPNSGNTAESGSASSDSSIN